MSNCKKINREKNKMTSEHVCCIRLFGGFSKILSQFSKRTEKTFLCNSKKNIKTLVNLRNLQ